VEELAGKRGVDRAEPALEVRAWENTGMLILLVVRGDMWLQTGCSTRNAAPAPAPAPAQHGTAPQPPAQHTSQAGEGGPTWPAVGSPGGVMLMRQLLSVMP
jgi:hypothetical protein